MKRQKILIQLAGLAFFAGFILAGSDGGWFPYANFADGILAFVSGLVLRRADSARLRGGNNGA